MSDINKSWKTLYSYETGKIYLHLKNNELISLNFSIVNKDMTDYSNNQEIETLTSPPVNSTLFLLNDELYALKSEYSENDSKDICGDGELSIIKYDQDNNFWNEESIIEFDFDDVSDDSFYQYPTILTSPSYNNTIYVYGGECNGTISNRLISLDFDTGKVNNITTSTKPQAFYGASNILAPIPQTQLIIGGKLNQGWLNMYQLATWDFISGWSFRPVNKLSNNEVVNSRIFPLLLPIFNPVTNISTVNDDLKIDQVLMIGGETGTEDYEDLSPIYAKLSMVSNAWVWNTTQTEYNLSYADIIGAATIFNTLIVINSTDSNTNKRSDNGNNSGYRLSLYDVDTFEPVKSLKENTQSILLNSNSSKSSDDHHTTGKIVLGTILPIAAIVLGIFVFFYLRRRRRKQKQLEEEQQQYNEIDYKYGYLPPPDSIPRPIYHQLNDSNSTLSGASIDSWMKKRQDYDKRKLRNSYLASNDTLNIVNDEETNVSESNEEHDHEQLEEQDLGTSIPLLSPLTKTTTSFSPPLTSISSSAPPQHKKIKILKKSISFTNSPPVSPISKFKRYQSLRGARSSDALIAEDPQDDDAQEGIHSDATSLDDQMDVQVLVSSKRRSILRVVNPDLLHEEDEEEEEQEQESNDDEHYEKQSIINEGNEDEEEESDLSKVINQHFEKIDDECDVNSNTSSNYNSLRQRIPSGQSDK